MTRLVPVFLAFACTGKSPDTSPAEDSARAPAEDGFVRVSAGTFEMGCTEGQAHCGDDEAAHRVTLTHDHLLGIAEVTQGEFEAVMGYNPSIHTDCDADAPLECPVEYLTWYEAVAYTVAVSEAGGAGACYACEGEGGAVSCEVAADPYECDGYRLPTEAEWEGAARCGTDLRFAGSDEVQDVAWIDTTSGGATHVGWELAPNDCGTYDMSGNVFEWTNDWL